MTGVTADCDDVAVELNGQAPPVPVPADITWLDQYDLALSSLGVRLDLVANELWAISRELQALAAVRSESVRGLPATLDFGASAASVRPGTC